MSLLVAQAVADAYFNILIQGIKLCMRVSAQQHTRRRPRKTLGELFRNHYEK
jgi:hypothetical protein